MSKKRVRLSKEEAIALGVQVKEIEKGRQTFRSYIDIEDQQKLNQIIFQFFCTKILNQKNCKN